MECLLSGSVQPGGQEIQQDASVLDVIQRTLQHTLFCKAVQRLAAPACAGPVCSAAGQLSQQAHTTHAATAGPSSGEGLPIVPPRPGSAIAGRPAENGHGPPPKVFTAPGLVSW